VYHADRYRSARVRAVVDFLLGVATRLGYGTASLPPG
jgi:hypothetical protein